MAQECTYFDSTEWDNRRWKAAREWPLQSFVHEAVPEHRRDTVREKLLAEVEEPADGALKGHLVGDVWPSAEGVATFDRDDVLAAWDAREETPAVPASCPHDPINNNRCVFHGDSPPEEKRAAFKDALSAAERDQRLFMGATLPHVNLRFERIEPPDTYPISLDYATVRGIDLTNAVVGLGFDLAYAIVDGNAIIHNTHFERHVSLEGMTVQDDLFLDELGADDRFEASSLLVKGETSATRAVFHGSVSFENARFEGGMNFGNARFEDVATFDGAQFPSGDWEGTVFHDVASLEEIDAEIVNFSGAEFGDYVIFQGTIVDERAEFVEIECSSRAFFSGVEFGQAVFAGSEFDQRVTFNNATVEGQAHFGTTRIDEFHAPNLDADSLVFMDATVRDGILYIPEDQDFLCNFVEAELGDIRIEGTPKSFNSIVFRDTEFDGFDFAHETHRKALEEIDWNIHEVAADVATAERDNFESEETVSSKEKEDTNREESKKEDRDSDASDLMFETTYLRAKQGARDQGDMRGASEFFIREMYHRRQAHWRRLFDSNRSLLNRFRSFIRGVSNGALGAVAGYGERPNRVVILSLVVLLTSAIAYPLTGGFEKTDGSTVTYANNDLAALWEGLYFSVGTFTTIGNDNLTPTEPITQALVGVEAFLGGFLIALLVFVFGRSMRL